MDHEEFDNYLSDCISTEELSKALNFLKKQTPGEPFLIFFVKDSGDGMVKGKASAWLQISTAQSDKLAVVLKDDDGKTEINRFELTLAGLADCLDALCSLQDQVDYAGFYAAAKKLL